MTTWPPRLRGPRTGLRARAGAHGMDTARTDQARMKHARTDEERGW